MENNDNRNFLIFLAIVFVTTIVALIVVLAITWKWIAEPVSYFFNSISRFQELQTLDYNFEIPEADPDDKIAVDQKEEEETEEEKDSIPAPIFNYIFNTPSRSFDRNDYRIRDSILQDAKSQGYFTQSNDLSEIEYNIQIPKIGFNSAVISGLGEEDLLEKGMWLLPNSGEEDLGEIVTICYSKFFFPSDKRTCEFLSDLELRDRIYLTSDDNESYIYEIYDIDVVQVGTENLYLINDPEEELNLKPGLRIITTAVGSRGSERLVIYAEQESKL